jgi:hypothetical protein
MTSAASPASAFQFTAVEPNESAVWLLDASGSLTLWGPDGLLDNAPPLAPARVIDITPCGTSGLWILLEDGDGRLRVARRHGRELDVYPASFLRDAKGVVGAQNGGLWLLERAALKCIHPDGSEVTAVAVEFEIEDFHEGANGALWALGGIRRLGGFEVKCLAPGENDWFSLPSPASAVSICGAPDGTAWSANAQGDVWRLNPRGGGHFAECQVFTGCTNCLFSPQARHAREVSVSPNGAVWILSRRAAANGYAVEWIADFERKEIRSLPLEQGAVRIAAISRKC